jgi:SAM-dependent methyltransferase
MNTSKEFDPDITHPFYFIRKNILDAIKENAHYLSGIMMDFGCGSKPYKSFFHIDQYIGVDFNGDGHDHSNENIDVYYNGKTIPFDNNYFDSILCSEVFEHLFNIDEILPELNRVLKIRGMILITCPFIWNEHEVPNDYCRYTSYGITHLLKINGFKIVKVWKKGTFIEVLFQLRNLYALETYFGTYNSKYYSTYKYFSILKKIFILINNVFGIVLNTILPKRYDIYLSNIIVAEKT